MLTECGTPAFHERSITVPGVGPDSF